MRPVVISARLFPPRVVAWARAMVSPQVSVRVVRQDADRASVQLAPADAASAAEADLRFRAALTAAAIRYFSGWAPRQGRVPAGLARRVRFSFEMDSRQVWVAVDASPTLWPRVLRALGRLRLAQPVVQSTDPVDRVILMLQLRDGGPVEEALREFVARIREELEGPAA